MALFVEAILPSKTPSDMDIKDYFHEKRIFISSTMLDLQNERKAAASAIKDMGAIPVYFESPTVTPSTYDSQQAYLHGVATSDIYVGIFSKRYGWRLPSGYSATHEEYNKAVELGLPIYIWINGEVGREEREGNLNTFLQDIQVFHATSQYFGAEDLGSRLAERLKTVAIEELITLFKFGQFVFPGELRHFQAPTDQRPGRIELEVSVRNTSSFNSYLQQWISNSWNKPSEYLTWGTTSYKCNLDEIECFSSDRIKSTYRLVFKADLRNQVTSYMMAFQSGSKKYTLEDVAAFAVKALIVGETNEELLLRQYKAIDFSDLASHFHSPFFTHLAELVIVEEIRKEDILYPVEYLKVRKTARKVDFVIKGKPSSFHFTAGQSSSIEVQGEMNIRVT